MQERKKEQKDLFGGDTKWTSSAWTASDDRVRGGKSQSYLEIGDDGSSATFRGDLDIKTLGGAGFASQRTVGEDITWNLMEYDGIEVLILGADDKRYTFNIKDTLLPANPENGREQSTISYEYDFTVSETSTSKKTTTIRIPWNALNATYRGREKTDAPPLDTKSIRRFGIMCRSFFGDQEGEFQLRIGRISAVKLAQEDGDRTPSEEGSYVMVQERGDEETVVGGEEKVRKDIEDLEKGSPAGGDRKGAGMPWWSKLMLSVGFLVLVVVWNRKVSKL